MREGWKLRRQGHRERRVEKERRSYPTVDATVLGDNLGVVSLEEQEGGEHTDSAPTKGSHDGIHFRQLSRKVHLLDEVAVRGSCSPRRPPDSHHWPRHLQEAMPSLAAALKL